MRKNDIIEFEIDDIGAFGEGIAHKDGSTIFAPFCIKGELVSAVAARVEKNLVYAIKPVIKRASPQRVTPKCSVFMRCGGCQIQHIEYNAGLLFKRAALSNTLKKFGIDCEVKGVVFDKDYRYRNKFSLPVRVHNNAVQVGYYAERSARIVEIDDCPIQTEESARIISLFKEFYSRDASTAASIRHLCVRACGNGCIITLVASSPVKTAPAFYEFVKARLDGEVGLYVNINTKPTNVILGEKFVHIGGIKELEIAENGLRFSLGASGFLQVNDGVRRLLYDFVSAQINSGAVIDAYGGAGHLAAILAKQCGYVLSIELVAQASNAALALAKNNNLHNLSCVCGDCAQTLEQIAKNNSAHSACIAEHRKNGGLSVVLDPPRKGCDDRVIQSVMSLLPKSIVYISCNPSTLCRDLQKLCTSLYQIESITPFDMFPQTKHIETVAILRQKTSIS